ncbi:MAG: efflux RND transporter periplasmic adaptor subunit [Sphingobacteriaceae bacterium]|nr:efflux RND transporter periplasmic adaptor subunit [Sphingobacteriaceae bacterium]
MKKRYFIYGFALLLVAYLVYYRIEANQKLSGGKGGGKPQGKGDEKPVNVSAIVVKGENYQENIEVSGSIEANEMVTLHSEASGLIQNIYFKEGAAVSKGAILLKINDKDLQAQLQQAKTKEKLSATTEQRAKLLLAKSAISAEEYDVALADLNLLKAQTQLVQVMLDKTTLRAPFSGKVSLRNVSVGEYLNPSTAIATLVAVNPVKVVFSVPEKYASQIKNNQTIHFSIEGSTQKYSASIFAIEPNINTQTRTLKIKALAANAQQLLLPGSFAKVSISLAMQKNAILIPSEAVVPVLQGKTVFISKNGKALQVPIQSTNRSDSRIVVSEGLKVGDTVLTTGAMVLKPESPLNVTLNSNN